MIKVLGQVQQFRGRRGEMPGVLMFRRGMAIATVLDQDSDAGLLHDGK